ncbi:MAG: hypothetical protein HY859_04595 [Caulobacterales bacterium]|nr:hypothetical protein [Caulobacterales bacterium]
MASTLWRAARAALAAPALVVLLAASLMTAGAARAEPVKCRVGAYVTSLSQVDTAAGTFRADFWMWSVCPTKDIEPLKTVEFVNAASVQGSLDSTLERDDGWWATRKFSGVFRQDFSLRNYPFDEQPLLIEIEEGVLDSRDFLYVADLGNSGMNPSIDLAGWMLRDFRLASDVTVHPTNFGDPSLPRGVSRYASAKLQIGVERNHLANFIKATFPLYISALLALISLLIFDGRMGLLAGTMFSVVLSFVSVERIIGQHDGVYLLDKLHLATLGLILAATAWGVPSLRVLMKDPLDAVQRRRDVWACGVIAGAYLLVNILFVSLAAFGI